MEEVGEVIRYFPRIGVAAVRVSKKIQRGDAVRICGHGTDFEQEIESMQIEKRDISEANCGDEIGVKVDDFVQKGDKVYLL